VAVDVRGGRVSVAGWTLETQMRGEDVTRRMQQRGVTRFVYTNVDRDGMLEGPDLEEVRRVADAGASSTRAASARSTTSWDCARCGSSTWPG
jgi:phosphoribosylformimino-5-aminoimidazole carboxamide ribonucleotide (ProFAR) isomerase